MLGRAMPRSSTALEVSQDMASYMSLSISQKALVLLLTSTASNERGWGGRDLVHSRCTMINCSARPEARPASRFGGLLCMISLPCCLLAHSGNTYQVV